MARKEHSHVVYIRDRVYDRVNRRRKKEAPIIPMNPFIEHLLWAYAKGLLKDAKRRR